MRHFRRKFDPNSPDLLSVSQKRPWIPVIALLFRAVEPDVEKLLKELLQKSADTNKFIR
jgi:hypothetical protein